MIKFEKNKENISIVCQEQDVSKRIDLFLYIHFNYSRAYFQKIIQKGLVLVNNKIISKSHKVKLGDVITISFPKIEPLTIKPQNIAFLRLLSR